MDSSNSVFTTDGKKLHLKSNLSKNAVQVGETNCPTFQFMWITQVTQVIINAVVPSSVLKHHVALQLIILSNNYRYFYELFLTQMLSQFPLMYCREPISLHW